MRLCIIESIIVILMSTAAWGQTTICGTAITVTDTLVSDTVNNSQYQDFESRIALGPITASESDFEIRFYKVTAATNAVTMRMVRCGGGTWEAFAFEGKSKISKYIIASAEGYEPFVNKLLHEKILTLPDQKEVDKKIESSFPSKKAALQARPSIMDGYQFAVEFKIGDKFRIYRFSNPESYASYYPKIEEFNNYISIKNLFENGLLRK